MAINAEQEALISQNFEAFIAEYHHGDIIELTAATGDDRHQPVVINAMTLFEANMEIGDYFNAYPSDVLTIFDKVLHKAAIEVSKNAPAKHSNGLCPQEQRMKNTLHARITGLPVCSELTRDTIPRSRDVGHFLSVTGTVIRTSVAKADFEQFYSFVPPVACPNPDGCNSCKFSCLSGGAEPTACRDYQEIKIQEQVQKLSVGSIPRSMVVVLEDDLVDRCKSGDDVTVYGVMCQRWKPFYDGSRCDVELVLKANNVEVNNQQGAASLLIEDAQKEFKEFWERYKCDPLAGRNQILLSLCPQVFGMYVIKLAVAMVLAGGVQRIDSSGAKTRGECHMLLVGDPGTGKSQFLKYAAKMMPRSVLTAGIGSTSAGLTVAAVKDGGDWHLEAGALVLSDGGLCCIDEFNSIKEHDRISIHEAMEQQSISVAKAGMVCKLNTRTTILAATNPKSQYDPNESLSVNVALASPLLSRFDLVLVLLDNRNAEWDRIISSFILEDRGLPSESSTLWSMEKMKAYFCIIKRLQPQVSAEANSILSRYYQLQRQSEGRNAARTTIRMLESLSRLAEAHARLMYREIVTIEDAVMAVSVMECSMQGGGLLGSVNAVLTSFPDDPAQQYQTQCQVLLTGLNLPLLLQKEMDRLARLESTEASSSEQPTEHQHHFGETDATTETQPDVPKANSSVAGEESGLDWFYATAPSRSSDEIASPVSTSTQCDGIQKTQSDVPANINPNLNLNPGPAVAVTAEVSGGEKHPEALHGSDRQNEQPSRSVRKVSKNRRERRINELQQGLGKSDISASNDVAVTTCDSRIEGNQGRRAATDAVRQDKMAASDGNIPFKFSDFTFKPKKMRSLAHISGASAPECNLDSRNCPTAAGGDVQQKVGSRDKAESARKGNGRRKNEKQPSLEGGSMKKQRSFVSANATLSFSPGKPVKENPAQNGGRINQSDDIDVVRGKDCLTPLKPASTSTKSTVTPSTLAKLSKFSFAGSTDPTLPTDLDKNHQMESNPRTKENVEFSGADLDKTEERQKTMEMSRELKVASCLNPATSARTEPGEPTHGEKTVKDGATALKNCGKMKRKCFELGRPTSTPCGSKGVFGKTSLFGSDEVNDDIFDTDWDKEIAKKAKV
ncbi:DNA helicase MCM9 isoform X2 [Festucalex cinctus]